MKVVLTLISPRRAPRSGAAAELLGDYIERAGRYTPCQLRSLASEQRLLAALAEAPGRTRPLLWLADSRGAQLSSEELAAALSTALDSGAQQLVLAIGPADGWSTTALSRADRTVAFGRITLPHELAAAVAAEQLYRALTIRAGHPYHAAH
jgi:23S rRNA (pseudouridine1915-N3)-methyltransferase